jgi:molybdate transport system substrate-binding protein
MLGLVSAWILALGPIAQAEEAHTVLVFAAASLTDALEELDKAFTDQTHIQVKASFAASSVLARQIEAGAPAEVFVSADLEWMDYLEQRQLVAPGTRSDLLRNRLVLIAPSDSNVRLKIAPHLELARALGTTGRLAMGDPGSVPAGIYGREALMKLGVWTEVVGRVAPAENVRAALAFVARGEAPLGIVYRTDALAEKRVRIVDVFPEETHPPITYPVALLKQASPGADEFMKFMKSARARQIFVSHGFEVLP